MVLFRTPQTLSSGLSRRTMANPTIDINIPGEYTAYIFRVKYSALKKETVYSFNYELTGHHIPQDNICKVSHGFLLPHQENFVTIT
jgi:hypothetical protein